MKHATEYFRMSPTRGGLEPEFLCCDWETYWIEWEGMAFPLSNEEGCRIMEENGWFLECDRDPADGIDTSSKKWG